MPQISRLSLCILVLAVPAWLFAGDVCAANPKCSASPTHKCGTKTHVCTIQIDEQANAYILDDNNQPVPEAAGTQFACVAPNTIVVFNGNPSAAVAYSFTVDFATTPFGWRQKQFNGGTVPTLAAWKLPRSVRKLGCFNYTVDTKSAAGPHNNDPAVIIDNN